MVDVAAAVIQRPDGSFLLGQRPGGKIYAGYWEFPGGKVEQGEDVVHALVRELREELGIEVQRAYPWIVQRFVYPHAHVQLHFYRVVQWTGTPHPHEEQALAWTSMDDMQLSPILPANGPVLKALSLPTEIALTRATEIGIDAQLRNLEPALASGVRMVMIRERQLLAAQWSGFAKEVIERVEAAGGRVVVNDTIERARVVGARAVHLTSMELMQASSRPDVALCGASCHDAIQLERAQSLALDYVFVGPVLPTPSHPSAAGLGWERFAALIAGCSLPVYAIGGMRRSHLERAWECGAHGVAMMRAPWRAAATLTPAR